MKFLNSQNSWYQTHSIKGEKAYGLNEAGRNIDKLMRKQSETRVAHMPKNPDAAAEQKAKLDKKKRSCKLCEINKFSLIKDDVIIIIIYTMLSLCNQH